MAGDTRELGHQLKQINLLEGLGKEVDEQFGKWGKERVGFLTQLCYAHQQAVDNQSQTLKEYEEERRRSFERALLIEIVDIAGTKTMETYRLEVRRLDSHMGGAQL